MSNKENYKHRIVYELINIEDKIEDINKFLTENKSISQKERDLLEEQVSSMYHYRDILIERICMYLGD